ncbi:MAG: 4-(cytidine 5'-diphospho)-2-C-methyl-D-erythritol kinase [archaeon]|jgi:4-diphosphocytidyl-2-C-methyl-D-erythritol kinase
MILESHAKLNLFLYIRDPLPNGFHGIDSVFQPISLFDKVSVEEINEDKIILDSNSKEFPRDESNLCWKATNLLKQKFGIKKGVKIFVEKNIPQAGGLGGGSANGAAVLKALNKIWKLSLNEKELVSIGLELGRDFPSCLMEKTSFCKNKEEEIQKAPVLPKTFFVIVAPEAEVPAQKTKLMYQLIDKIPNKKKLEIDSMLSAIKSKNHEKIFASMGNTFEEIDFPNYEKIISQIKEFRKKEIACMLAGSGPSYFAAFKKKSGAEKFFKEISKNEKAFLCESV